MAVDRNPRKPGFPKSKRSSFGLPPDAAIFLTFDSINKSRADTNRSAKSSARESARHLCSKSVEHDKDELAYQHQYSQSIENKRDLVSKIIPYDKSLKKTLPRIVSLTAKSPRLQTPNHSRQNSQPYGSRPDLVDTQDGDKTRAQRRAYRFQLRSLDFEKMHKPTHLDYTTALQAAEKRAKIKSTSFVEHKHPRVKQPESQPGYFVRNFFNNNQDRPREQKTYSFSKSGTKHLNYQWEYSGPTVERTPVQKRILSPVSRARLQQAHTHSTAAAIQHEDWRLVFEGS